ACWVMFPAALVSADDKSVELQKLYGKWRATEGIWNGKDLTKEQAQECRLNFTPPEPLSFVPARVSLYVPDKLVGYTTDLGAGQTKTTYVSSWVDYEFTLDSTQSPKSIDMEKTIGAMRAGFLGIYEVDGDSLKVCFNMSGFRGRPKEFKSPRDSEILFLTLKRAK